MADFMINMSNQNIPVYKSSDWTDPGEQIGTIYPTEAFGCEFGKAGTLIVFRNKSGKVTWGYLPLCDKNGNDFFDDKTWREAFTECTDYPYGTARIDGADYKTFKFRRSETIYTPSGKVWGTVAAGMEVACKTAMSGESHPEWKGINYVKSSKTNEWVAVTEGTKKYGFVDTGLDHGSMPTSISMYGTW